MKHAIVWRSLVFLLITYLPAHALPPKMESPVHQIQGIPLKFNLKPGEKYLFSSTVEQNITQEMMGQRVTTQQNIVSDYIYDVQATTNGITTINIIFKAIKMDANVAGGMQQLHFDSDDPEGSTNELKVMNNLIGKSFLMEIDEAGSVKRIEGLGEIMASMNEEHAEFLKQSFGDSTMMHNLNQITNIYPNKTVVTGDNWTKQFSGSLAGMLHSTATSEFTLSEIKSNIAVLTVNGKMALSKLENTSIPILQEAEFDLQGTQTGTLEVDIDSGLPVLSQIKQNVNGSLSIQGMQVPMTIASNMTITGKKM